VAAFTADASQATGMDGALRALVALPFGGILLHLVGAGLIAYGLYALVRAPAARLLVLVAAGGGPVVPGQHAGRQHRVHAPAHCAHCAHCAHHVGVPPRSS
jgi:hypothetical protein